MKKLPKIYQNELNRNICNNKKVFDSLKEDELVIGTEEELKTTDERYKTMTVDEKIKELINQKSYIFNIPITLVFETYEEKCQIAGVVNNNIITMDNKIIKISDLKDIKILKK